MVQVSGQILSPITHSNVYENGYIDLFHGLYTGGNVREIKSVVEWLRNLLSQPDKSFAHIGNPKKLNPDEFNRKAEQMTREHAMYEGTTSVSSHFHAFLLCTPSKCKTLVKTAVFIIFTVFKTNKKGDCLNVWVD